MKKEFPGHFSGAAEDIEKIWEECIFVLDANVLLNLYRYSDFTCSKLLEVFEALSERLWVPHQVVLEYLNNRLAVIGDVGRVYEDAVKKIDVLSKSLESHNQHPFIKPATLVESERLFKKMVEELNENKLVHAKRISVDEVKDQLQKLLEGKVGAGFSRERLDKVIVDGKARYEQKTPPGFCDVKKGGDSIVFTDICRPYGDYIVWLQILEQAKLLKRSVIFVTGDTKDDWWASFQGKTLGPHPQLVQEFLEQVGRDFYMYPPDRFLERASKYLKQDASEQAVNEIRDIREEDSELDTFVETRGEFNFGFGRGFSSSVRGFKTYEKELATLEERADFARSRLALLQSERKDLIERENQLIREGAKPGDDSVDVCVWRLEALNELISMLKEELVLIRTEFAELHASKNSRELKNAMHRD